MYQSKHTKPYHYKIIKSFLKEVDMYEYVIHTNKLAVEGIISPHGNYMERNACATICGED
jgi:hypothetical protein